MRAFNGKNGQLFEYSLSRSKAKNRITSEVLFIESD
jgi:hypothetical protein